MNKFGLAAFTTLAAIGLTIYGCGGGGVSPSDGAPTDGGDVLSQIDMSTMRNGNIRCGTKDLSPIAMAEVEEALKNALQNPQDVTVEQLMFIGM